MMPMTPPLRVALDLDGVFADFNTAFAELLHETSGRRLFLAGYVPEVWDWPEALGYTKREISAAWARVKESGVWWAELSPYDAAPTALSQLNLLVAQQRLQLAFVTSRPGVNAHWQSVWWLAELGIEHPQVIVAAGPDAKVEALRVLGSQIFVDDRPENLLVVHEAFTDPVTAAPTLELWMYTQPWNAEWAVNRRIGSLPELVSELARRSS